MKIHFIVDMDEQAATEICPHLGVGYLSSYLKKMRPETSVSIGFLDGDAAADVARERPDLLAVSTTSRYFLPVQQTVAALRKDFDIPVVWGGVHISIFPGELPDSVDVGVIGEGEETLVELLDHFDGGGFSDLAAVKGIAFRHDGKIVVNEKRPFIEPLDRLPTPDLDLLKPRWNRRRQGVILTSRGCPYKCRFCASSFFWDRTRLHSAEYVVEEMLAIVRRYGVRKISIYDDFFTIDHERVARISELKRGHPELQGIGFDCLSRIDNFTPALADELKRMGVYRVGFGVESGCQRTLDYLKNGKVKVAQVERVRQIVKDRGLICAGSFVIGSPHETEAEIEETFRFVARQKFDVLQIGIATPFPGTRLWEDASQLGRIDGSAWSDSYYTLFANNPQLDVRAALAGKKLVTGIERERFIRLAVRGAKMQCDTNFGFNDWYKHHVRKALEASGLGGIIRLYHWIRDR